MTNYHSGPQRAYNEAHTYFSYIVYNTSLFILSNVSRNKSQSG